MNKYIVKQQILNEDINNGVRGLGSLYPTMPLLSDSHRYNSDKGEISLLYPCAATMGTYEIYCAEGNLFEDIERFRSLEEAEEKINQYLE